MPIAAFQNLHPVLQALVATCFTWAMTALGAVTMVAARGVGRRVLATMLGFATGVMIAASAMIFVVIEELVPESQRGGSIGLATLGAMIGFAVMMALDVGFG